MTLVFRGAITAAEDRNHDATSGLSPVEVEVVKHCGKLPDATHPTLRATAAVNHGRWIVSCPWCFSASMAARFDHRFFCVECLNRPAGGKWVGVDWPDNADDVESLLVMRPNPATRNWHAHETVADLLAENESRGVM
jgi:hypothetical protein